MPKPPLPEEYKFGTYGSMVAVKMMEKDMPTPMTIEMEAEDIRAALDQINLYIGYTAGHVDDEKYRATWKAFIKVHSALLTKTTKNVTCENLSNADGRQDKWSAFYKYVESETDDGEMLIDGWVAAEDVETIRSALQSPRVPVIEGLDEAIAVINKFIRARDAEIDFLPEKSTKNTSEWISHFMHNVNYSLSFNDWMNLDKVRAYAELQKGV